ncbi:AI-2E family transporter [Amylibacter ulvae]|uniref:AI-2E family transporter n=1 Tax=Paramylibacter ulvae TaxID=1651968 RepID=A0ABQ3CVM3_9RHOB|nr:AI-2E family transporter [Amylibacter ulvae]GHA46062.1 AI-2E family transporter [Amylibacter ulvae]
MALSVSQQAKYWGIGMAVTVFLLWLLGGILLPFITGMAIAYFLDPTADRLEAMGFSRIWATVTITVVALFVCTLLVIILIPQLVQQTAALATAAPEYIQQLQTFLAGKFPSLMDENSAVRQGIESFVEGFKGRAGEFASAILASAFSIVDALIFIVVAPVVAFYMLLDWDRMVATVDSWLPRDHLETIRGLARDVDGVLAGFVRGQLTVCAILGTFYAIALMAVGLQFGLIVGLVAGLLTFIPYVGSVIGGVLAIGLALFQFWGTPEWIIVVAVIFVVGQMVEGNVLTPKLVGGSVGLHPVWLMFALSAFGTLMGFTGMLVAVPVAACLGVFFRFGISQYLDGRLYTGLIGKRVDSQDDDVILTKESDTNG